MMTKADFEEIAEAVAEAKRRVEYGTEADSGTRSAALTALQMAAAELATACARRYKGGYGFARQKFVEAAGFPEA